MVSCIYIIIFHELACVLSFQLSQLIKKQREYYTWQFYIIWAFQELAQTEN